MDICVTLLLETKGEKKAVHQGRRGGGGSSLHPK